MDSTKNSNIDAGTQGSSTPPSSQADFVAMPSSPAPQTIGMTPNPALEATASHQNNITVDSNPYADINLNSVPRLHPEVEERLSAATEQNLHFKKLQTQVKDDLEAMKLVSHVLQHIFSGNQMMYVPAEAMQAVVNSAFAHLAEYQALKETNPAMNINDLMHNIGPNSQFLHDSHQFLLSHHENYDVDEEEEKAKKARETHNRDLHYHHMTKAHGEPIHGHEHGHNKMHGHHGHNITNTQHMAPYADQKHELRVSSSSSNMNLDERQAHDDRLNEIHSDHPKMKINTAESKHEGMMHTALETAMHFVH